MNGSVTIRGVEAAIYWSYLSVATVRGWTVVRASAADPGTFTATVVDVNTFRLTQQPLVIVVRHAKGAWRWPIDSLQIAEGVLTARLGPPE